MRKIIGVESSAVAVSAMDSAPASAAPQDQVTGSGQVDFGGSPGQTIVNGPGTPTDAHGQLKIQIPGLPAFADVDVNIDCVNVVGNIAVVSGTVVEPDPSSPFRPGHASFQDNGTPGNGTGDPANGGLGGRRRGCGYSSAISKVGCPHGDHVVGGVAQPKAGAKSGRFRHYRKHLQADSKWVGRVPFKRSRVKCEAGPERPQEASR